MGGKVERRRWKGKGRGSGGGGAGGSVDAGRTESLAGTSPSRAPPPFAPAPRGAFPAASPMAPPLPPPPPPPSAEV